MSFVARHKCGCTLMRKSPSLPVAKCNQHGLTEIDPAAGWSHFIWWCMSHAPTGEEGPRPSDKVDP
jgi:hypothetical protein